MFYNPNNVGHRDRQLVEISQVDTIKTPNFLPPHVSTCIHIYTCMHAYTSRYEHHMSRKTTFIF